MTIESKIILDSIGPEGQRLTTFQLKYPRFVHADFMTHRVFSRNASSSRATPVSRTIRDIRADPAIPMVWAANQKGMQGGDELPRWKRALCRAGWLGGMYVMTSIAGVLAKLGLHKQYVNRLTEPWVNISVVVTSTQWKNFVKLRAHEAAMPELQVLGSYIRRDLTASDPQILDHDQWHLPYVDISCDKMSLGAAILSGEISLDQMGADLTSGLIKLSAARCARVSYLTHDKKNPKVVDDIKLYERLTGGDPIHASPTEHQAKPDYLNNLFGWACPHYHGNLPGWQQHRKFLVGEDAEIERPKRKYEDNYGN
jgi:hypothetical protein